MNSDPIVFIPGLLCDDSLWKFQVEHFEKSRACIVAVPCEDDAIAGMAARILAAAPPRFILCGLSMGGYVSFEIMRVAPERVSALILSDTTPHLDSEETRRQRLDIMALARRGRFSDPSPKLLQQWLSRTSLEDPAIRARVGTMVSTLGKEVYIRQQTAILGRVDSVPALFTIKCPTLVLVGREDRITPLAIAEEMAGSIAGAKLRAIEEAGHLPPIERPESYTFALENFLKFETII